MWPLLVTAVVHHQDFALLIFVKHYEKGIRRILGGYGRTLCMVLHKMHHSQTAPVILGF